MKKLLFGLLALVFTTSVMGQKTQEEMRLELAKGMITFNNSLKTAFTESKDYNDFKTIVCGGWESKITKEGDALLAESYRQLKSVRSEQDILSNYHGKEMAAAALWVNDNNLDSAKLFGSQSGDTNAYAARATGERKCKWWQLLCHLKQIFGKEAGEKIMKTGVDFLIGILKK